MARIVITGANRGIGLELARQFGARGDEVVAACRKATPELVAVPGVEIFEEVELTDVASIAGFARQAGKKPIDILVNNAGILSREMLDSLDFDEMRRQYDVNAIAPLRMSRAILPAMSEGGKVALVTSRVGSLGDNSSGGNYGYRMSKAAANMAGVNLAIDLKSKGIAVVMLHPGYVRTGMTGGKGFTDADAAAKGLIERIDALSLAITGSFWHAEGYELPW